MKNIFKGLLFLLIVASIILLSDLSSRKNVKNKDTVNIAVLKLASRPVLDQAEKGFIDYLSEQGFDETKGIHYDLFCPEGDMPTAHTIATLILNRKFDYVHTISTPALQTMASANTKER